MRLKLWRPNVNTYLVLLAVLIGVASGLFSILFKWMIDLVRHAATAPWPGAGWLAYGPYLVAPVIGGLLVGPIVNRFAAEAKGHGVPEVMYAVAKKGGIIRLRVPIVKAIASALTIGTGGSAGREGPIVQIGSGLGSVTGQWFRMSEDRIKTLLACGAAAGIAATFNAPIGGAIFALEVILGEFTAYTFSLIVVSAVAAAAVSHVFWGNVPVLQVPQYQLVNPGEFLLYAGLGLLAAGVALLYTRVLYFTEDLFDGERRVPEWVKPAIGGLLFGSVALLLPESFGAGYEVMDKALLGHLPLALMATLVLVKILTTSLTIGSGGSGGIFAPGLFIGTMLGGAFGAVVHGLWPETTAASGAYALVGMGAVFAGMTQAPITGILLIFEMTRDYRIILPLMLACVIASLASGAISRETIYTLKLLRRGISLRAGRDVRVLQSLRVRDVMSTGVETVPVSASVGHVVERMGRSRHNGFPVVDGANRLVGVITLMDVRNLELPGRLETPVAKAMTQHLVTVTPEDTLEEALHRITFRDVGRLPVVDPQDPSRLVGLVTRSDILKGYERSVLAGGNGVPDAAPSAPAAAGPS